MNAKALYRSSAVLFVLFAAGHTFGFLRFRPPTPEALAVRDAMTSVHFQVGHASLTYGGFYTGFGLYITLYMVFSALLSWQLGDLAMSAPQSVRSLSWIFFYVQVAGLILSLVYFSAAPAVLSGLVAVCLGWGALKTNPRMATAM
jgi:hypothetical protein